MAVLDAIAKIPPISIAMFFLHTGLCNVSSMANFKDENIDLLGKIYLATLEDTSSSLVVYSMRSVSGGKLLRYLLQCNDRSTRIGRHDPEFCTIRYRILSLISRSVRPPNR